MKIRNQNHDILWTGGWDSTFRLLQLLLIEQEEVQPHYIIFPSRNSTSIEIERMKKIRAVLQRDYPSESNLLLPTKFCNKNEIEPDNKIYEAYQKSIEQRYYGDQYVTLAEYCKQHGLSEMELALEKNSNEEGIEESLTYSLHENRISPQDRKIFKHFSLPLIDMTKQDMEKIATGEGWFYILKLTWFCHHPMHIPFGKTVPCGGCRACENTIKEGYEWRIPLFNRLLGKYYKKIFHSTLFKKINASFRSTDLASTPSSDYKTAKHTR